ncbi:MAG: hypothetical protein IJQ13_04650 [Prevotella sp.]|nr:hypothetical protein [Prevotella sp.]
MATVTINISRAAVYSIAEGISITISLHNGGVPTYEQLWASASESKKLDIYYREAISDLERRLMDWVTSVSGQFSLTADGTDYQLEIVMNRFWPTRLEGLLKNKVQDFLVHAVTAGWLNDFDGLSVKTDYKLLGAGDLVDIREIIHQRSFDFARSERTDDGTEKDESDTPTAGARNTDSDKDEFVLPREAGARRKDDIRKNTSDDIPPMARQYMQRHKDNAFVEQHSDWTDMSGTGIGYKDRPCSPPIPPRPAFGMGFTPQDPHRPVVACRPKPQPIYPPDPPVYPEVPTHAIPPKYPTGEKQPHPNGIGWSDDDKYNAYGEEKFIESHDCGHHDCGMPDDQLDWDFDQEETKP